MATGSLSSCRYHDRVHHQAQRPLQPQPARSTEARGAPAALMLDPLRAPATRAGRVTSSASRHRRFPPSPAAVASQVRLVRLRRGRSTDSRSHRSRTPRTMRSYSAPRGRRGSRSYGASGRRNRVPDRSGPRTTTRTGYRGPRRRCSVAGHQESPHLRAALAGFLYLTIVLDVLSRRIVRLEVAPQPPHSPGDRGNVGRLASPSSQSPCRPTTCIEEKRYRSMRDEGRGTLPGDMRPRMNASIIHQHRSTKAGGHTRREPRRHFLQLTYQLGQYHRSTKAGRGTLPGDTG